MTATASLEQAPVGIDGRAARETPVHLRLTHRGRVVFGTIGTLLTAGVLALLAALGATSASASAEQSEQSFSTVVAAPGDSLWGIAESLDPEGDPRDLVAELVTLNGMDGSGVQAGESIAVPTRYADAPGVIPAQ
ncbi:hypothetical protein GCM10009847_20320 [Leucobacter tardus]|uniref:hypothetical protein n=1 Tax=Leucobacter tardus TaxID=501483 RepID=UPI001FBADAB7|nr:hypothetical protein [Leucobacter tardus]